MLKLPPLSASIDTLTDEQAGWLDRYRDGRRFTPDRCVTCHVERTADAPAYNRGSFNWWADDEHTEVAEYECPCIDQYVLWRAFSWAGVPLSYQRLSWSDYIGGDENAVEKVLRWVEDYDYNMKTGIGMILHGNSGSGKTFMSTLTIKSMVARGFNCFFVPSHELINVYMNSWRDPVVREWFERRVRETDLLVIDDLGKESNQVAGKDGKAVAMDSFQVPKRALDSILRYRIGEARPTIITTNTVPGSDAFDQKYSPELEVVMSGANSIINMETDLGNFHSEHRFRKERENLSRIIRPILVY